MIDEWAVWQHADVEDIWLEENATLCRQQRRVLCQLVDGQEVQSRPRLTRLAGRLGLRPGAALDLLTGWDFNRPEDRQEAYGLVERSRPALLMLSPHCAPYSVLRNRSANKQNPEVSEAELEQADAHLQFCCQLAKEQVRRGRGFLMESPRRVPCVRELHAMPGVEFTTVEIGLRDKKAGEPLSREPTGMLGNVPEVMEVLRRWRSGDHHPEKLVRAVLQGLSHALNRARVSQAPRQIGGQAPIGPAGTAAWSLGQRLVEETLSWMAYADSLDESWWRATQPARRRLSRRQTPKPWIACSSDRPARNKLSFSGCTGTSGTLDRRNWHEHSGTRELGLAW